MANHNELQKVSSTPQPNSIVYSSESGNISAWLDNDPVIAALKQQTEFIGTVATAPEPNTQLILTQFVVDTVEREPRNGDEVAIEDVAELWLFNETEWIYFSNTELRDATTTSKGVVQIGTGLNVSSGVISVDNTIYSPSRNIVNSTETTPSIALNENTDYIFSNALTSLTLTTIPNSIYYTRLVFTTSSSFTFSATNLTQYFYYDNPPTFYGNTTYEIIIIGGRAHINYIGTRKYPINKLVATNPSITPTNNVATWTITNTLGTSEVVLRVFEITTGETVEMDSTITAGTITLTFYSESNVNADTYKAVIIG